MKETYFTTMKTVHFDDNGREFLCLPRGCYLREGSRGEGGCTTDSESKSGESFDGSHVVYAFVQQRSKLRTVKARRLRVPFY